MENQIFSKIVTGFVAIILISTPLGAQPDEARMPHFSGYFEMESGQLVYYPTRVEWYFVYGRDGKSIVGLNFVLPYEDIKRTYSITERRSTKKGDLFICGKTTIYWDKRSDLSDDEPLITISKTDEIKLPLHKKSGYKAFSADKSYASGEAQVRVQRPR